MSKFLTADLVDLDLIKSRCERPKRAVVTAGMPYANGPLHLGHLAGAHIPADIHTRWMGMLIGRENVLFVCGTDDHGSATELSALKSGTSIREWLDQIHDAQETTLGRYGVDLDVYSGTSRPECLQIHTEVCQDFIRRMSKSGLLTKKASRQWYDPEAERFLQDRFVTGHCPNPQCDNEGAYSDGCDSCGEKYDPADLQNPRSAISDATPELRETQHLWLNMWDVSEVLREWIQSKKRAWRKSVYNEVIFTVLPSFRFDRSHEEDYKGFRSELPKHKSRYGAGKKQVLQFESKADMELAIEHMRAKGIATEVVDGWARRSLTRDVSWGIPIPEDVDGEMAGKTLYVWPESLIAPISFSQVALKAKGQDPARYEDFWTSPDAKVYQFLGQDNVYFYVLMQGAMWIATQEETDRPPAPGDYQLTDIFGCYHLQVDGDKMSKSKGNFYTGDQLLDEKGYTADQIRYFLATLGLADKTSNWRFDALDERNRFLAGPMNAALEKPISACHSKFSGVIPEGRLHEKVAKETGKIIQRYLGGMQRANYIVLLGAIENYARLINSMFAQFKPHDDRLPEEERCHALYSSFYVLKNIMIMLYPFVPDTMNRLRESLNLPETVFSIDELGKPMPAEHRIGAQQAFFPSVD